MPKIKCEPCRLGNHRACIGGRCECDEDYPRTPAGGNQATTQSSGDDRGSEAQKGHLQTATEPRS